MQRTVGVVVLVQNHRVWDFQGEGFCTSDVGEGGVVCCFGWGADYFCACVARKRGSVRRDRRPARPGLRCVVGRDGKEGKRTEGFESVLLF